MGTGVQLYGNQTIHSAVYDGTLSFSSSSSYFCVGHDAHFSPRFSHEGL